MASRIGVTELGVYLVKRHALKCSCCGAQTMAYWEPPNQVVIRAKHHGREHELRLTMAITFRPVDEDPLQDGKRS